MTRYIIAIILLTTSAHAQTFETAFSPHGGGVGLIVKQIDQTKKTLDIAAYQFTSPRIARAVCLAENRGVVVRLYADRLQRGNMATEAVSRCGVQVKFDRPVGSYRIMHNKYMIFDGKDTMNGSFNFSKRADERNVENVLISHDAPFVGQYQEDFNKLWEGKK